jgi:hypothetical protein
VNLVGGQETIIVIDGYGGENGSFSVSIAALSLPTASPTPTPTLTPTRTRTRTPTGTALPKKSRQWVHHTREGGYPGGVGLENGFPLSRE